MTRRVDSTTDNINFFIGFSIDSSRWPGAQKQGLLGFLEVRRRGCIAGEHPQCSRFGKRRCSLRVSMRASLIGRGCVKTHGYFVFRGLLTPPKVTIVEYSAI